MLGRTDSRARAIILLLVFVVVAGALGVRLAYWQVLRRDAQEQRPRGVELRRARVRRREHVRRRRWEPPPQLVEVRLDPADLGREVVRHEQRRHALR